MGRTDRLNNSNNRAAHFDLSSSTSMEKKDQNMSALLCELISQVYLTCPFKKVNFTSRKL